MIESKIAATERLRKDGRWEAACLFRDGERERLRAEGMPRREAVAESWRLTSEKFQPLLAESPEDASNVEIDDLDVEALAETFEGKPDLVRDTLWAYDNLQNEKVRVVDAPTRGSLSLLQWARGNRDRFFEQLLPKAMTAKAKEEDQQQADDDLASVQLEKLIADINGEIQQAEAKSERVIDCPACNVRIVLPRPRKVGNDYVFPLPHVCPADHPGFALSTNEDSRED